MCRLSWNLGALTSWNPQGLSRPVMGLLFTTSVIRTPYRLVKIPKTFWSVWRIAKNNLHWCFVSALACLKKNQVLPTETAISWSSYYFSKLIQRPHNTEEIASRISSVPLIQEHSYGILQIPKILWTTFMISVRTFPLKWNWQIIFFISKFRPVLNVVCFLLGNSPASEFYMPTFRNTLSVPSS